MSERRELLRIGVDFDDVLFDTDWLKMSMASVLFPSLSRRLALDQSSESFQLTHEEDAVLEAILYSSVNSSGNWLEDWSEFWPELLPIPGAATYVPRLSAEGNRLFVVSRRGQMGIQAAKVLIERWKIGKFEGIFGTGPDTSKRLAAGASTVMFGRLLAATEESPGTVVRLQPSQVPGRFQNILDGSDAYTFKEYRGMGSIAAMKQGLEVSSEDEFHGKDYRGDALIAEGVEGLVPCSGTVKHLIDQMVGGVQSGMYYVGARTIEELWRTAQFLRITQASLIESHPHDLFITNAGANYQPS